MRSVFIILILFNSLALFSQSIEISGGMNENRFFDYQNNGGHFSSSYTTSYGYTVGIALDDVKIDWLNLRFTLNFDNYGGKLEASNGSLAGGTTTSAEVNKSLISFGFFPLNYNLFDKIELNFGFEVSRLLHEKFKGTYSGWSIGDSYWVTNIQDQYSSYSAKTYFGLLGRVAYKVNLTDNLALTPQYFYYFGLANEFDEMPDVTKSMRHYLCVGLKKKIK